MFIIIGTTDDVYNKFFFFFFIAVYRQGEIGSSWYAVLGGSLEARLTHTTQSSSSGAEKVSAKHKTIVVVFLTLSFLIVRIEIFYILTIVYCRHSKRISLHGVYRIVSQNNISKL